MAGLLRIFTIHGISNQTADFFRIEFGAEEDSLSLCPQQLPIVFSEAIFRPFTIYFYNTPKNST